MQSLEEKERNAKVVYLIGRVMFVGLMLVALDDMHVAWKFTHGWNPRLDLVAPWFFLALLGLGIWTNTSRGKIERDLAGGFLMMIGVAVHFAYDAMGKLASTHF
jgi:hypothetical protein